MKENTYFDDDQHRDCVCPDSPKTYERNAKIINLAIQGGGAHGAYAWGIYMGNPALFPLFYHTQSRDLMILHINPLERGELPTTSAEIMNRLNEITFNSSLLKEMRAIAFVTKLIEQDWLKEEHKGKLKHILIHSIRADKELCDLSVASNINTDWHFLLYLRDLGRNAAKNWLEENFKSIGKHATVDLHAELLDLGVEHAG
jgi:NTE family protein